MAGEFGNLKKSGELYWEFHDLPITDEKGASTPFGAVKEDLTERTRVEDALQKSERRYRTLFETMTEGFALHEIICDERGIPCDYRFLEANPAFERQTGLNAGDILGRTLREVLPRPLDERYAAGTHRTDHFEQQSSLRRRYEVYAFQTEPDASLPFSWM
jgi:PAS domain S-box-containing protein